MPGPHPALLTWGRAPRLSLPWPGGGGCGLSMPWVGPGLGEGLGQRAEEPLLPPRAGSTWGPMAGRRLPSPEDTGCHVLVFLAPSFPVPIQLLPVLLFTCSPLCQGLCQPLGVPALPAPALFHCPPAPLWGRTPEGFSHLQTHSSWSLAQPLFVLSSGFFVSPDSSPPPPGYRVCVLGMEHNRRNWSVGRLGGWRRGVETEPTLPPDLGPSSLPSSSQ